MLSPSAHRRAPTGIELYLATFKTPIGYLRAAQLLLTIASIVLVSKWTLSIEYGCLREEADQALVNVSHAVDIDTFKLSAVILTACDGDNRTLWHGNDDATRNAGYFYFVCGLSLLYSLLICVVYICFWSEYISSEPYVLLDLLLTVLLFIFYLIASCVWWGGANIVATATNHNAVAQLLTENAAFWDLSPPDDLLFSTHDRNWMLTVSVLCCWALTVLYAASCYYIVRALLRKIAPDPENMMG